MKHIPLGISVTAKVEALTNNKFKLDYNNINLPVVITVQMCKNNRLLLSYKSTVTIGAVKYDSSHILVDPVLLNNSMDRHCDNLYYEAVQQSLISSNVAWFYRN